MFRSWTRRSARQHFVTGVDSSNGVTYALTNTLIGRTADEKGNVSYLELTRLKLSQTYNITTPTIYSTTPTIDDPTDSAYPAAGGSDGNLHASRYRA